jgi:DNA-binding XRE family transcriptional regulator
VERSLYPNLKLTMYRSGIRQNTLAKSIGINEASLSRIINGTRQPAPEVRVQIATILRENVDWLFQQTHASEASHVLVGMTGAEER